MGDNRQVNKTKAERRSHPGKAQNSRPTIGLLIGEISDPVSWDVWAGAESAACAGGANLVKVAGGALQSRVGYEAQANVLYDLVGGENVDGLVIWGGSLGQYAGVDEVKALCERYRPLPIVNATMPLDDIPSVFVSNYEGVRQAMVHLVEVHRFRRIAFVCGPEGHPEAEERYRAYREVLDEYKLPFRPTLIAPGEFSTESGTRAVESFFDERGLRPQVDIQAIVAVDDSTAQGALAALQARGILVPDQVAVVGFDDTIEATFSIPSLTTVPALMREQARQAVEMLLSMLDGEDVPLQVSLSTDLIVRESCGCMEPAIAQSVVELSPAPGRAPDPVSGPDRQAAIAAMEAAVGPSAAGLQPGWAALLVDSFATDTQGQTRGIFLSSLRPCLRQAIAAGYDVSSWQMVLSEHRRHVLPFLKDDQSMVRAENLWQQARVMVGGVAERARAQHALLAQRRADTLREISQTMTTMVDIEGLTDVLAEGLPQMKIRGCHLSLYENPREPDAWSRQILAYDTEGRIELEPGGQRFVSRELVPGGVFDRKGRCSLSLLPLYFRKEQIGFLLLDVDPQYAQGLATLCAEVSNAVHRILLAQRVENRALQLRIASEVSRAAGSILDPKDLIQQAVDLAQERFALYYAGLFLVESGGKWAELHAGTGEAGRQMVANGHRLEVGGESMIGNCIAQQQARIALDVGEEAVRFENPLLPDTRSEMALPLISHGEVIGALTVQSTEAAAFSDEDVAILQTMADQLANAIVNARLYEREQQAARELGEERTLLRTLIDNLPDYVYIKDRDSRFVINNTAHLRVVGAKTQEEVLGKTDFDLFPQEHAAQYFADEQALMESGETLVGREEIVIDQTTGVEQWVISTKVPLRDAQGKVYGFVGLTQDITERRQAEAERERLLAETNKHIQELDILNDIGRKIDGRPPIPEFLQWVAERIPAAVQHPDLCVAAVELGDEIFGEAQAVGLPRQIVQNLFISGERVGRVYIAYQEERDFLDEESSLLGEVARRVGGYLENQRLIEATQARAGELAILNEMARTLTEILDVQEVLERLYHYTAQLIHATDFYVALYDADTNVVSFPLAIDEGEHKQWQSRQAGEGLTEYVIRSREPLLIEDNVGERLQELGVEMIGPEAQSWLGVPMMRGDQVIGMIVVQSYTTPRLYNGHQRDLLMAVSSQAAIAIENARLLAQTRAALTETEEQAHRLALLNEMSELLSRAEDVDEVLNISALKMREIVPSDLGSVALLMPEGDMFEVLALQGEKGAVQIGAHLPMEGTGLGQALRENRLVITPDTRESELSDLVNMAEAGFLSAMSTPLVAGGRRIGTLNVGHTEADAYRQRDGDLLVQMASLLSSAFENRRLFEQIQRRSVQLRAATEVSRAASSILDLDTLLTESVNLIRDQFDYYYAGLFLVNEGGQSAILRAGTGEAGQAMLKSGHKFTVGGQSMIGKCVADGQACIALQSTDSSAVDVGEEAVRFENPLLPDTRSEMALPLVSRGEVVGALSIQSVQEAAFSEEDIAVLETMASQLATSIENVRLFEQTQLALQEMEDTQRRYVEQAWQDYTSEKMGVRGYVRSRAKVGPTDDAWLPAMSAALEKADTVIERDESGGAALAMPLRLHGEVVGALGGYRPEVEGWAEDDIRAVEAIVEQMALALENQRLFEEEQRARQLLDQQVRQVECLNDIGQQISESPPLDEFLEWVTERVPSAMRYARLCVVGIEYEDQVYGTKEATTLPCQMVQGLIVGGEQAGRVTVAYTEEREFLDEESALLGDITRRIGGYVENRLLLEQTQRRAEEQAILNEMSQAMAARLNVDRVLEEAHRGASRLLDISRFSIGLYDENQDLLTVALHFEDGETQWYSHTQKGDQGISGYILRTREPVLILDNVLEWQEERGIEVTWIGEAVVPRCWMGVPLVMGERVLGVMFVQSPVAPNLYDERDLDLLTTVASTTAIALESARLFEQAEFQAEELATLNEMSRTLASLLNVDDVLEEAYRAASLLLDTSHFSISLYDEERDEYTLALHVTEGEMQKNVLTRQGALGMSGYIIANRVPVFVRENVLEWQAEHGIRTETFGEGIPPQCWMGVPLLVGERVLGTMFVQSLTTPRLYDEHDRDMMVAIAAQVAIALENARLLEETQAALAEVEATHRSYLRQAWQDHLRQREILERSGFYYDQSLATRPEDAAAMPDLWLPEMEQALILGEFAEAQGGDGGEERSGLAMPITVRGETIGVLGVEAPGGDYEWTDEDRLIIEAIGEQLAQALESARLFADTQRRAERERLIGEITAKMRATTDIRDILETTATELGEALGVSRSLIRMGVERTTEPSRSQDALPGNGGATEDGNQ